MNTAVAVVQWNISRKENWNGADAVPSTPAWTIRSPANRRASSARAANHVSQRRTMVYSAADPGTSRSSAKATATATMTRHARQGIAHLEPIAIQKPKRTPCVGRTDWTAAERTPRSEVHAQEQTYRTTCTATSPPRMSPVLVIGFIGRLSSPCCLAAHGSSGVLFASSRRSSQRHSQPEEQFEERQARERLPQEYRDQ